MAAFEELVHRYEARIFTFIKCRTGAQEAQDLTQIVFVRAFQKIHTYTPRYRFSTWLYTIARRMSITHYRKRSVADMQPLAGEIFDGNDPSREASWNDARNTLWDVARRQLPENQFTALYLRAAEQMSIQEIAHALRKTQSHVKVLLHRARKNMLSELAQGNETLAAVRDTAREAPKAGLINIIQAELHIQTGVNHEM